MNNKKIGIGIIGCGSRLKDLFSLYPEFFNNLEITALYDIKKQAIDNYQNSYGKNIMVYEDYKDLVKDPRVKWIFIGSPNYAHKDQLIASFKENKHVFCEKPLAISIEECKEIKKTFEGKNLNFFIGYILRYSQHYKKIKEIIELGKIGNIVSLEFNETIPFNHGSLFMTDWRRSTKNSGGFLLEKCCHDIDLVNWMVQSIPREVVSFGGLNFFKPENSSVYKEITDKKELEFCGKPIKIDPFTSEKDIVDNQVVILEFYNKVRASFHTNSNSSIPERRIYICGSLGTIRADLLKGKIELRNIFSEGIEIIETGTFESHGKGDLLFLKDLEQAMLKNEVSKNFINEAVKSAAVCIAIDKSMKDRQIINMESVWKYLEIKN